MNVSFPSSGLPAVLIADQMGKPLPLKKFALPAVPNDELPEHFNYTPNQHVECFRRYVFLGRTVKKDIQLGGELFFRLPVIE